MNQELIGDIQASDLFTRRSLPVAETLYGVASWYQPERRWKVWSQWFSSREKACEYGRDDLPNGHTHFVVLETCLPGT